MENVKNYMYICIYIYISPVCQKFPARGRRNWRKQMFYDFQSFLIEQKSKMSLIDHSNTNTNIMLGDGWNKDWSLPPPLSSPSPSQVWQKFPANGAEQIEKQHVWWFYMILVKKKVKQIIDKSMDSAVPLQRTFKILKWRWGAQCALWKSDVAASQTIQSGHRECDVFVWFGPFVTKPCSASTLMAPPWHHGTIAPRASQKNKNISWGKNTQK